MSAVEARELLGVCMAGDWKRVVQLLKTTDPNSVPLCSAVYRNQMKVVKILLSDKRTDINKGTALHIACLKGNIDMVNLLLAQPSIEIRLEDQNGRTAMELCRGKVIRGLIENFKIKERGDNIQPVNKEEVKPVASSSKELEKPQSSEPNLVQSPLEEIEGEGDEEISDPKVDEKPEEEEKKVEKKPEEEEEEAEEEEEELTAWGGEINKEILDNFRAKMEANRNSKRSRRNSHKKGKRVTISFGKLFGGVKSKSNSSPVLNMMKESEAFSAEQIKSFEGPNPEEEGGEKEEPTKTSSNFVSVSDDKGKALKRTLAEREREIAGNKKLIKILTETVKKKEKLAEALLDQVHSTEKLVKSKKKEVQFRDLTIKTIQEELEREKLLHRSLQKEIQKGRMKIFRIDDKEIEKGKKIGEGAFGKVYEAKWNITRDIAIKEVKMTHDCTRKEILQEFQDQVSLVHSNILRVYGYSDPPGIPGERKVRILMEKMDMDIRKYMIISKPTIATKFDMMRKMVSGLHYMHSREPVLLHRDIKSLNFLVSGDGPTLEIKITDFGLMKTMQSSSTFVQSTKQQGTINWMAPELLQRQPNYSVYSDIYALGITFFEVLFEKFPYRGINQQVVYDEVKNQDMRPDISDPKLPKIFRPFLEKCWRKEPKERYTAKEIIAWLDKHEKKIKKKYGKQRFPK